MWKDKEKLEVCGSCRNTHLFICPFFSPGTLSYQHQARKGTQQLASISKEAWQKREPGSSQDHAVGGHETTSRR